MKEQPLKDDWIHLVNKDIKMLPENTRKDEDIVKLTKYQFKKIVRKAVHQNAIKQFEAIKLTHKKVKHIKHNNLNKPQDYITSKHFTNKMVSTLFNLRSRCDNEFKENFHNLNTNMDCFICKNSY